MAKISKRILIIDDDLLSNLLSKVILMQSGALEVIDFIIPEEGLEYIKAEFRGDTGGDKTTLLLLDINMPDMTGWDFLEEFDKLQESVKSQLGIYLLSSSIDQMDIERAKQHPLVIDMIEKPLNNKSISDLFI